jgi:hypothetical protein
MSIEIVNGKPRPTRRRCRDIPVGTAFRGSIGGQAGLMLRAYDRIILLGTHGTIYSWVATDPDGEGASQVVEDYVEVDLRIEVIG